MTPELSDPAVADVVVTVGARQPIPSTLAGPGEADATGSYVATGPAHAAAIGVPTFLRSWRGYDRHQVDTFAHQSLALIQALRRRAQRAESRLAALEKQLVAYRRHGHDVLADPAAQVEMATSRRLGDRDEGLVS